MALLEVVGGAAAWRRLLVKLILAALLVGAGLLLVCPGAHGAF